MVKMLKLCITNVIMRGVKFFWFEAYFCLFANGRVLCLDFLMKPSNYLLMNLAGVVAINQEIMGILPEFCKNLELWNCS